MRKTMKSGLAAGILLLFSLVSAAGEGAGPQSPGQTDVSGSEARKRLVESVAAVVETNYVFPDVAAKIAAVLASDAPAILKQEARWALPEVEARLDPPPPTIQSTQDYEGAYGKHRVTARECFLFCALNQGEAKRIVPLGKDLYAFEDKSLFYVRLQFLRDGTGAVYGLRLVYDTGQQQDVAKNR